ncbi:MAG: peptidoglycan-binding protein [Candidatus Limiplasma sp.]|nr:peptidoglycan-binding protein [Candidatus Limiplasma sp.]
MRQGARTSRWVAGLLCVCWLASLMWTASAATYPYEVVCGENVNLRKAASSSAVVLKRLQAGDSVTILEVSGSYYKIKAGTVTGFALKEYVDGVSNTAETGPTVASSQPAPVAVDKYPYDTNTIQRVKLRKTDNATADVLLSIPGDEVVTVLSLTSTGFARVKYKGKTGFVVSSYVNLANIPAPTPKPGATASPDAEKYTVLQKGSAGAMVKALQEALTELTYYKGEIDSKYGAQTEAAVNACKKRNGLPQDGIADAGFQLLLYEGTPKNPQGYRKILKIIPPVAGFTIRSGNVGEPVKRIQERLKELNYYIGDISGNCDKATVQAIKDFQQMHDMRVTGEADAGTQERLFGAMALSAGTIVTPTPPPVLNPPKGTVRPGDTGEDVKIVQQRLKDLGYYTGQVDGKFGDASVKSLKAFQKKSALKEDGVCGIQTRAVLFAQNAQSAIATAVPPPLATPAPLTPETTVVIKAGSRGDIVRQLQQRLMDLGYYSSRLDGVYLEDDITAVRAFQKANNLAVDGKAGYNTQSVLYSDNAIRGSALTTPGVSMRYGSTGADVTALQNRLIELGYLTGVADGKFGVATKSSVIAFQRANNLVADGVAGGKTQAALYATAVVKKTVEAATSLKEGMSGTSVKDLQTRLISLGYLSGTADGKFGSKTSMALMEFQKRNNLTADGIAGNMTLAKLNSTSAKQAASAAPNTPAAPLNLTGAPSPGNVRYANWYTEVRSRIRLYPNVTIYDFVTGLSWQVNVFSVGAHADGEPMTANDTANMNRAFGGITTWNPKAVWVVFSDGSVYMASTHNTPHGTHHRKGTNFNGHLCIHFPRTEEQVKSIGPYATSHQKAIDLGWQATLKRAAQ